ncbi:hypothetical protein ACW9H6_27540, partial [Pseudomonas sp. SDO528_S397]
QDCDSCCRGFDPHRPPHILESARLISLAFFFARSFVSRKNKHSQDLGVRIAAGFERMVSIQS